MPFTAKDFRKWLDEHDVTLEVLSEQTKIPLSTLKGSAKGGRIPAYLPVFLRMIDALHEAKEAVVEAVGFDPEDPPLIYPCPWCGAGMTGSQLADDRRCVIRHPPDYSDPGERCPLAGMAFNTPLGRWNRRRK